MLPLLFATALVAAPAAEAPCKTQGSPTAHALGNLPRTRDKGFDRALAEATSPQTTAKAVAATRCKRAHGLSGDNGDPFPRRYIQGRDIAYLVALPVKPGDTAPLYGMVKVWGSGAVRVDGLFDAIPTDDKLAPLMADFSDGGFEPLTLDPKTGVVVDSNNDIPVYLKKTADAMGPK